MNLALGFFPSRSLAVYVGKTFLLRCLAMLAMLVLVLQMLGLLSEAGTILAYPGNGDAELWRYVSLRVPQLIARFLPFAVLLGTLVTLASLNANSEVVAMKAGGLSAHQILAPLMATAAVVALLNFAFNERIVARANATMAAWESAKFGPIPQDRGVKTNIWVRDGEDLIRVGMLSGSGTALQLRDIDIFDRHGNSLVTVIHAPTGRYAEGAWQLETARSFDVARGTQQALPRFRFGQTIRPDEFTLSSVNADNLSYWELRDAVKTLEAAGRPVAALQGGLWHKISGPLSTLLMPLLGSVAAFGIARSGRLFVRAVIGMALGFAFFVVDNFALSMGNLGVYPPVLAAWAPFLLFFLVGEAVLVTTEE